MARKFLTALDLSKNELQNAAVHNLPSAPAAPVKGQLYYNTTGGDDTLYWFNGTSWIPAKDMGGGYYQTIRNSGTAVQQRAATNFMNTSGIGWTISDDSVNGETEVQANPVYGSTNAQTTFGLAKNDGSSPQLARTDHVHGTPVHDAAAHSTIPISGLAPATGPISMGGNVINNVGTPVAPTDAANKGYVDNAIAGLSWKDSVRATNTVNYPVATGGLGTQDGVTYLAGDRILLRGQTNQAENGIWIAALGAWTRATDADSAAEILGAAVYVEEGTTWGDTAWVMTTNAPITMGTTALVWSQFAGGGAVTAGAGMTQAGNVLNVITDVSLYTTADSMGRANLAGDVIAAAGSVDTTIAPNVVTNTKLADMPAYTIKGNYQGSPADPADLTTDTLANSLGLARKKTVSAAAATSTVVSHNFNTQGISVTVWRSVAPFDEVECDVEHTSANTATVRFAVAPAALGDYYITVFG